MVTLAKNCQLTGHKEQVENRERHLIGLNKSISKIDICCLTFTSQRKNKKVPSIDRYVSNLVVSR